MPEIAFWLMCSTSVTLSTDCCNLLKLINITRKPEPCWCLTDICFYRLLRRDYASISPNKKQEIRRLFRITKWSPKLLSCLEMSNTGSLTDSQFHITPEDAGKASDCGLQRVNLINDDHFPILSCEISIVCCDDWFRRRADSHKYLWQKLQAKETHDTVSDITCVITSNFTNFDTHHLVAQTVNTVLSSMLPSCGCSCDCSTSQGTTWEDVVIWLHQLRIVKTHEVFCKRNNHLVILMF